MENENKINEIENNEKKEKIHNENLNQIRRRFFTQKEKEICWNNSQFMLGRDPKRWRLDAFGNPVIKYLRGCYGDFCHEYDHIIPFSKGGESVIENCQILKTKLNRLKSNDVTINYSNYMNHATRNYSENQLDFIEKSIFGDIKKPDLQAYIRKNNN